MNKSKAKGTRAESNVVKFLKEHGIEAKRKALAGSQDQGDVEATAPCSGRTMVLEVKTGKQTAAPSRSQLEEWLRQTEVESENSGRSGALVIVRYRRKIEDADVYLTIDGLRVHMFLDEFARFFIL